MDKPIADNTLLKAAGIVAVGGLLYALVGEHSTTALMIAAGAGIIGAASFTKLDQLLYNLVNKEMQEAQESAFEHTEQPFQGFDDIWNSIQDWYGQDPRNGEIVWKPGVSKFDTTVPNSVEGKFRFFAMVTPSKDTGQNIYFCIETSTKSLLAWDERAEADRNDLPGECQLVEDLRKQNRVSAEETHRRIMNSRVAELGPGGTNYAGFMGRGTGQNTSELDLELEDEGDDE